MKLGVITNLRAGPDHALAHVQDFGFSTCQLQCWDHDVSSTELATLVQQAASSHQITITTIWVGLPGRTVWDFVDGPTTIGLVPEATRAERMLTLKRAADFAQQLGVASITTHVGFIPECASDPGYAPLVACLREIAVYCAARDLEFWFETGQETPITLLRTIEDINTGNLGINLDPANLLMYGKANPIDALDIFGAWVSGVHVKDGDYPVNGRQLGPERPIGAGRVDFPRLLNKLRQLGYAGALTIEREISGVQQIADIRAGKLLIEQILHDMG
jgi:sugar phosphate isomerase/epimerase